MCHAHHAARRLCAVSTGSGVQGQRVLTADTADDRGTVARAWLFQTFENPGAPGPASADTPLPTAAPGDAAAATAAAAAAPLVTATYSTAIAAFALRGGVLSASEAGLQEVLGEPAFRGAAQYDAEQRGLVVLSTLRLDAARDSLEDSSIRGSMFHMLDPDTLRPVRPPRQCCVPEPHSLCEHSICCVHFASSIADVVNRTSPACSC